MKRYLVMWTYIANYGKMYVEAESAEEAMKRFLLGFSEDFRERGSVYIFENDPVLVRVPSR
jgi:hypothetical protein